MRLGLIIQFTTGHNWLARHLSNQSETEHGTTRCSILLRIPNYCLWADIPNASLWLWRGCSALVNVGSDHSMDSCLISTPGNSANTDSIREAKEQSYPWTNKQQSGKMKIKHNGLVCNRTCKYNSKIFPVREMSCCSCRINLLWTQLFLWGIAAWFNNGIPEILVFSFYENETAMN